MKSGIKKKEKKLLFLIGFVVFVLLYNEMIISLVIINIKVVLNWNVNLFG